MKKSEKPFFVDNLNITLKEASGVILIDHTGLTVKKQQDLKKKLKDAGAKMLVVKNTLFKIAATSAKTPSEITTDTVLSGPTAIIITDNDALTALQVLSKFAKENEVPQMKVGVIDGIFQDKDTLIKLSTLPGKNILYGQLLASIKGPLYGLVSTLQGNQQKLVYLLEEYKSKRV